jgi:hypothetical protein
MSREQITVDVADVVAVLGRLVAVAPEADQPVGSPFSVAAFERLRDAVGGPVGPMFDAAMREKATLLPKRDAPTTGASREAPFPGGRCPRCHGTPGQGHSDRCPPTGAQCEPAAAGVRACPDGCDLPADAACDAYGRTWCANCGRFVRATGAKKEPENLAPTPDTPSRLGVAESGRG